MSTKPMSTTRLEEIEHEYSGIVFRELTAEIRRLQEPQQSATVEKLLKPFDKASRVLANSDWSTPQEDAAFEDAIDCVRAALTAPSPFDRLEAWLRENQAQLFTVYWDGEKFCSVNYKSLGTGPTLSEAVAAALDKAGAK